ncbi:MAG: hypothetical protein ACI9UR_002146, partial [Bacteroidia bacterium]
MILGLTGIVKAQCPNDNAFAFDMTPPACPGTFSTTCLSGGEYVTIDVTAGSNYTFTTCGDVTFDTQLTLYDDVGGFLDYNDDALGCGLQSTITWTATYTGTVNLLLDEYSCSDNALCMSLDVTCAPPIQTGNGCNTDITICTPGLAGPFGFSTPGNPVSSCLDWFGLTYGYIVLYITQSGPLNMLIDGDATNGFVDVSVFSIPSGEDPCVAIQDVNNEIGCNYATNSDGCNQFGTSFPCGSSVPAPNVTAGDVLMIIAENWSNTSTNFSLDLAPPPGAQTGPPDATINPVPIQCLQGLAYQLSAVNGGGDWSGAGVSATGLFDPSVAGIGPQSITYTLGVSPCQSIDNVVITVVDFIATASATDALCNGVSDGIATVSITTGIPAYVEDWGGENPNALPAGIHPVTVTDGNGCIQNLNVTVSEPTPVIGALGSTTPADCNGAATGSATVSASGGTPPYTFDIGAGPVASGTFTNLSAGAYSVTVEDDNGCTDVVPLTITEPTPVVGSLDATVDADCNGAATGAATVSASGGTPPYTFDIGAGPVASGDFIGLSAGPYSVTVEDGNGCTDVVPLTITEPTPVVGSLDAT